MRSDGGRSALRSRATLLALALGLVALLSACGGAGGSEDATVLRAGQLDIKLPDGFKVVDGKVQRPAEAASAGGTGAAAAGGNTTETTIVSTKEDPTTALFAAFGKFRACLDQEGVKFVGAPDASNPNSPTNDPTYIKGLTTCAARSNIQQALASAQSANDNLTPAQIKQRNKGYLVWRSCMIDRGWKIAKPVPDSQGRLFSFGGSGAQNQIEAPPGKDLLSSKDLEQCAAKSQKAVGNS
jgi:hypothetical protein